MVELIAIVVIMACILLVVLPALNNTIKNSEEKKKEEALNSIYMAAENYLMAYYDDYKIDNSGDTTYIYITDLISNDYMSIDTLNPNNDSTFSNKDVVKVTRNEDGTFSYELDYLKTLIETLLEQYSSDNTTGLLRDSVNENLYYYKGTNEEVANNYLWYEGFYWRVLEFDNDAKTITLITQQPITAISMVDSFWTNSDEYDKSYVNTWLNEYFYNLLPNSLKDNIIANNYNVGGIDDVSSIIINSNVGLLDYQQYIRASNKSISNNYLKIGTNYWLSTKETIINFNGLTNTLSSQNTYGIRPVIKIKDINAIIGSGSINDSFRTGEVSTGTNDVKIGESINISILDDSCGSDKLCTFKVIDKDEDSVKVTLNGNISSVSKYGGNYISVSSSIYEKLNIFYSKIPEKYKYSSYKNYYSGDYNNNNYTNVILKNLSYNIGMPTIGEIFTSGDISNNNDSNNYGDYIENKYVSSYYWTMNNTVNYLSVNSINSYGGISVLFSSSDEAGIRPVIFLKNNLTFTGGNGTLQNPYTLD